LFLSIGATPLASNALAAQYDLCARGVGDVFTSTIRVRLTVDGPDLGEHRDVVAAEIIRRRVWSDRAQSVFVEDFDSQRCSAALGKHQEFTLFVDQDDLGRLAADRARSASEPSPTAITLNERAVLVSAIEGQSIPGAQPYYVIRVHYATNRNRAASAGVEDRFGSERGKAMSFGAADVTIPKTRRMGELETPSIRKLEFSADPARHLTVQAIHDLDRQAWRRELELRASALGAPGVLLFIHGYNVSFYDAAIRTGQLAHDLAFPGPAVFFSWPSRGQTIPYTVDEENARWAVDDMHSVLGELASLARGAPVYVIAHSMGNRVFTEAFRDLLERSAGSRRAFKELVLAAPDIDAEVFKRRIAPHILGVGPRVTLYASDNDVALAASRFLRGGYRRLGEAGPTIAVLRGMETVDATHVRTDFLGHSYFGDSKTVMSDLFYLIRKGAKPAERFALRVMQSAEGDYWEFKR
jgi:esterase/lipase superfamily enzyme